MEPLPLNESPLAGIAPKILIPLSLLLLWLASQRLYAWPLPFAWEIGIGATEWAHWLCLIAVLLTGVGALYSRTAAALAVIAGAIAFSPLLGAALTHQGFSFVALFRGLTRARPATQTIVYANQQSMDIYQPVNPPTTGAPVVIVIHGGSWARGSRLDFAAFNGYLQDCGYFVATLDYRLAPAHPYPAAMEDLDAAYDYLKTHAAEMHLDMSRVCWLGRSAGAHLALLEAYRQKEPARGVIAFYPPTYLTWSYEHPSNPRVLDSAAAIRDFLGGSPEQKPLEYTESSPLLNATPHSPPTLLMHGGHDDLVYLEQSHRLQRRLDDLKVSNQLLIIPWANHGFDINLSGPSGQLSSLAVVKFLEQVLKL